MWAPHLIISIRWFQQKLEKSVVKLKNGDGKIMSLNQTRGCRLGSFKRAAP